MAAQESESLSRRSFLSVAGAGAAATFVASNAVANPGATATPSPTPPQGRPILLDEAFEVRKRQKFSWVIDLSRRKIRCFPDPADDCVVSRFLPAQELTPFHDSQVAQLTQLINAHVSSMSAPPGEELAILVTPDGPFLAFVERNGIGPADLAENIEGALGIRKRIEGDD